MKKMFMILAVLCTIAALSCGKKAAPVNLTIDDFKKEDRLATMVESVEGFSSISQNDREGVVRQYALLSKDIDYLVARYGKQQAKAYAFKLMNEARAGLQNGRMLVKCCSLNSNGTTDQSCCSFWEKVVVIFQTLDCSRPYPGAPQSDIDHFYQCIQDEVCENC